MALSQHSAIFWHFCWNFRMSRGPYHNCRGEAGTKNDFRFCPFLSIAVASLSSRRNCHLRPQSHPGPRHPSSHFFCSTPRAHAFHVMPDCPYTSTLRTIPRECRCQSTTAQQWHVRDRTWVRLQSTAMYHSHSAFPLPHPFFSLFTCQALGLASFLHTRTL